MHLIGSLILILILSVACSVKEAVDIGNNYTVELSQDNPNIEIYRSSINNRKLNGKVIHRNTVVIDSTLEFTSIGNFHKGVLHGCDSTYRNNKLIRVENYRKGVKHGDQIEIRDSIKIVSPFINGILHGFQSIYVNNQIQKKSYFNTGIKDSVEYFYDSLGQVVTTFKYHFKNEGNWKHYLDLENHSLISFDGKDTLQIEFLERAEFRGSIIFYSHDPKGIGKARAQDVIHESVIMKNQTAYNPSKHGSFYIIKENACIVCDYIDYRGTWVAYENGFGVELEFYELTEFKK